ncbi:MAG: acetoacetate--CoA ligase [Alphaproteobacteria bacterium]
MRQDPLWRPTPARAASSEMARFRTFFGERLGQALPDYPALHRASVEERGLFWSALWDYCGVIGEKGVRPLGEDRMPGAQFFPEARLNYAENLLRDADDREAIVFRAEDRVERRMTRRELLTAVGKAQRFLKSKSIGVGDRVAAMLPNCPEAIVMMVATASIGAIWSSCSPDFGARGVLDRFSQIEPKLFIGCDGYFYNRQQLSIRDKIAEILDALPTVEATLIIDLIGEAEDVAASLTHAVAYSLLMAEPDNTPPHFMRLPFNHPLFILFSSGTTGIPKCIVHGAGGTLLQHIKEHRLHSGNGEGDRVFYFTTLGWMMWNWLVSALACGSALILYDGSPFAPRPTVLFDYAQKERVTFFGTSAKYLDSCRKLDLKPNETHDLSPLRALASTGSPLAAETFEWVYRAIKSDLHLASISGGTDIVSCFVLGDPASPVYAGEIQRAGLGMAVDIFDDDGYSLSSGKGELVCKKAFPSMPISFWNDPEGKKYRAAYFERFPGLWHHGDFAEWTAHGGLIIHGRSDATLNPGGVRIGTAEIYAQVEQIPEVIEALAIGQDFAGDVRVILFVRLREGVALTSELQDRIRKQIRTGASPRHVPQKIIAIADIPRTKSGKITELAVRDIIHGREVKNREALANPEALDLYRDLTELRS